MATTTKAEDRVTTLPTTVKSASTGKVREVSTWGSRHLTPLLKTLIGSSKTEQQAIVDQLLAGPLAPRQRGRQAAEVDVTLLQKTVDAFKVPAQGISFSRMAKLIVGQYGYANPDRAISEKTFAELVEAKTIKTPVQPPQKQGISIAS